VKDAGFKPVTSTVSSSHTLKKKRRKQCTFSVGKNFSWGFSFWMFIDISGRIIGPVSPVQKDRNAKTRFIST